MACDALFWVPNSFQVDSLVPTQEQTKLGKKLANLVGTKLQLEGVQEFANACLTEHGEGF